MPHKFMNELAAQGYDHHGGNFILDKGMPPGQYAEYVRSFNEYIKLIKLGWTTWSLFKDSELQQKLKTAEEHNVPVCLGGTLFEISYVQGIYRELLKFLTDMNIQSIEIASGFAVDVDQLPEAVSLAKEAGLSVMVEVGYKDEAKDNALTVEERIRHIQSAKTAGADYVILEAREIGSGYSVFKEDKGENSALMQAILNVMPLEQVVFEAPLRENQISLVNALGPNVHMGNIPFDEIPRVETIRRGLHASTFATIQKLKNGDK